MKFGASIWPFQWDTPYDDGLKRIAGMGFKAVDNYSTPPIHAPALYWCWPLTDAEPACRRLISSAAPASPTRYEIPVHSTYSA